MPVLLELELAADEDDDAALELLDALELLEEATLLLELDEDVTDDATLELLDDTMLLLELADEATDDDAALELLAELLLVAAEDEAGATSFEVDSPPQPAASNTTNNRFDMRKFISNAQLDRTRMVPGNAVYSGISHEGSLPLAPTLSARLS